jgi:hypothetical protein
MGWEEDEDRVGRGTGECGRSGRTDEVERWGVQEIERSWAGETAHSGRARKTAGRNDFDEGNKSGRQRLAGGRACSRRGRGRPGSAGREPPCGDVSGGDVARNARRGEVRWRAAEVEKARREGGGMGLEALGGVSGGERNEGGWR